MTNLSLILDTDSYKHSHYRQYPPGTEAISSYVEARAGGAFPEAVFFGLQSYLKNTLSRRVTMADVDEAARVTKAHGVPFNEAGWRHIAERGGALPLEISAAPEGTVLPEGNVMVQVVNTDPSCAWLTSFVETALLRAVWYPTTVATVSWRIRRLIGRAFDAAGGAPDGTLEYMLNDFGARGVSSRESAALGGMAHLLSFDGTDNMAGLMAATRDYGAAITAQSVPAAEHSTITAWGRGGEEDAYRNMMTAFEGYPIISVVSDSYDLDRAVNEMWGGSLKGVVEASGSRLVVRPDSGDPATIVVRTVSQLMNAYGYETTPSGLRVLPDHVRVIQGDGVEEESIAAILEALRDAGIAPWNVVFGMGGGLLQKVDRDTLRFAMKASAIRRDGAWADIQKKPATDMTKASKPGRLALVREGEGYATVRREELGGREDVLRPVWRDGELLVDEAWDVVRGRVRAASVR